MIINFDKLIYDKDSVYSSIEIWLDYFNKIDISESKDNFIITLESNSNIHTLSYEFSNFVLDKTSSKEISQ